MEKLPTLAELHVSPQDAYRNDAFNTLLNQPPHASWLKKHPIAGTQYLPIDKVEFLLRRIFQQFRIEVIGYSQIIQSVCCHVRLHYLNPVTGQWSYHDGVGASAIQTNSGALPTDLTAIKSNGVQLALPIAKSQAIKDAADHLGSLFGGNLNRKDTVEFQGAFTREPQQTTSANQPAADAGFNANDL